MLPGPETSRIEARAKTRQEERLPSHTHLPPKKKKKKKKTSSRLVCIAALIPFLPNPKKKIQTPSVRSHPSQHQIKSKP